MLCDISVSSQSCDHRACNWYQVSLPDEESALTRMSTGRNRAHTQCCDESSSVLARLYQQVVSAKTSAISRGGCRTESGLVRAEPSISSEKSVYVYIFCTCLRHDCADQMFRYCVPGVGKVTFQPFKSFVYASTLVPGMTWES